MNKKPENLSQYLRRRSREICKDNGCKKGEHNCESYAYITKDLKLMDICYPDFFQGCSQPHAAIALPWTGNMTELKQEVDEQCFEME
jgi:hypothetical protein